MGTIVILSLAIVTQIIVIVTWAVCTRSAYALPDALRNNYSIYDHVRTPGRPLLPARDHTLAHSAAELAAEALAKEAALIPPQGTNTLAPTSDTPSSDALVQGLYAPDTALYSPSSGVGADEVVSEAGAAPTGSEEGVGVDESKLPWCSIAAVAGEVAAPLVAPLWMLPDDNRGLDDFAASQVRYRTRLQAMGMLRVCTVFYSSLRRSNVADAKSLCQSRSVKGTKTQNIPGRSPRNDFTC